METPLPPIFMIKASSASATAEKFVLCTSEYKKEKRCWNIMIIKDSKSLMEGCELMCDGIETTGEVYLHERASSRHDNPVYYESCMNRTKRYVKNDTISVDKIYEYKMSNACKILPTKFYRVHMNEDPEMKWHFQPCQSQRPEPHKIPIHVQEGFIEFALMNKDSCPITLETFERGNVICTPCGHLFSRSVMGHLETCPTCRAKL